MAVARGIHMCEQHKQKVRTFAIFTTAVSDATMQELHGLLNQKVSQHTVTKNCLWIGLLVLSWVFHYISVTLPDGTNVRSSRMRQDDVGQYPRCDKRRHAVQHPWD